MCIYVYVYIYIYIYIYIYSYTSTYVDGSRCPNLTSFMDLLISIIIIITPNAQVGTSVAASLSVSVSLYMV